MAAPTNAAFAKKVLANSEPSTHGPLRPKQILAADRRYRRRSGHVRASALTISVENDPEPTLAACSAAMRQSSRRGIKYPRRGTMRMRRREFIVLIGGAAVLRPLAVRAQRPGDLPTIAFLGVDGFYLEVADFRFCAEAP